MKKRNIGMNCDLLEKKSWSKDLLDGHAWGHACVGIDRCRARQSLVGMGSMCNFNVPQMWDVGKPKSLPPTPPIMFSHHSFIWSTTVLRNIYWVLLLQATNSCLVALQFKAASLLGTYGY